MTSKKSVPLYQRLDRAAGVFISIDFDYFVDTPSELPTKYLIDHVIKTPKKDVNMFGLFDYGHSEYAGSRITDMIWQSRMAALMACGLHPADWLGRRTAIEMLAFQNTLGLITGDFYVADSHVMARCAINKTVQLKDRPIKTLYHFDAHHDLGYGDLDEEIKNNVSTAGSWLFHALRQNVVDKAVIVYPQWKGLHDTASLKKSKHWDMISHRVTLTTELPLFLKKFSAPVFLCRSSAWTPPHLDERFLEMLVNLNSRKKNPLVELTDLDAAEQTGFSTVLKERALDWEAIHALAEQFAKLKGDTYVRPIAGHTGYPVERAKRAAAVC